MPGWIRAALLITAVLAVAVGIAFARGQNRRARMGGPMARPKQIWLIWAVYTWFFATPLFAMSPALSTPLRTVLGAFSILMIARGVVEVVMLYVTKSWRPPYGIAHDVLCAAVLLSGSAWVVFGGSPLDDPIEAWGRGLLAALTVSLLLETYYAVSFHRAVDGRTTGDDGVWFATADDPRFARVVLVTSIANIPLVAFVLGLLAWVGLA